MQRTTPFTIPREWVQLVENRMRNNEDLGKFLKLAKQYTSSANTYLNSYLREQDALQTDAERGRHSEQFFEKLRKNGVDENSIWDLYNSLIDLRVTPPSEGVTLYRGLPYDELKNLRVGDIYYDAGFMSFSFSPSVARGFALTAKRNAHAKAINDIPKDLSPSRRSELTRELTRQDDERPVCILRLSNPEEGVWFGTNSNYQSEYEFVMGPRCEFEITNIENVVAYSGFGTRTPEMIYHVRFIGYRQY